MRRSMPEKGGDGGLRLRCLIRQVIAVYGEHRAPVQQGVNAGEVVQVDVLLAGLLTERDPGIFFVERAPLLDICGDEQAIDAPLIRRRRDLLDAVDGGPSLW